MLQTKKIGKISKKPLKEMETNNLLDAEFKTLVIRMFNEQGKSR